MLPQVASLADTRGVLRLSGEELTSFLQVCLASKRRCDKYAVAPSEASQEHLMTAEYNAGATDKRHQAIGGNRCTYAVRSHTQLSWPVPA